MNENIDKELRKILKKIVNDDNLNKKIDDEDNLDFIKDLEFDSIDIVQFVVEIEDKFKVNVLEEDNFIDIIKDVKTVREWLEGNNEHRK
jgi:acyl carrier protein